MLWLPEIKESLRNLPPLFHLPLFLPWKDGWGTSRKTSREETKWISQERGRTSPEISEDEGEGPSPARIYARWSTRGAQNLACMSSHRSQSRSKCEACVCLHHTAESSRALPPRSARVSVRPTSQSSSIIRDRETPSSESERMSVWEAQRSSSLPSKHAHGCIHTRASLADATAVQSCPLFSLQ